MSKTEGLASVAPLVGHHSCTEGVEGSLRSAGGSPSMFPRIEVSISLKQPVF